MVAAAALEELVVAAALVPDGDEAEVPVGVDAALLELETATAVKFSGLR